MTGYMYKTNHEQGDPQQTAATCREGKAVHWSCKAKRSELLDYDSAYIRDEYLVEDSTSSSNVFPLCAMKMSMDDCLTSTDPASGRPTLCNK